MRRELGQGRIERGQGSLSCGDTAKAMTGCFLDIGWHDDLIWIKKFPPALTLQYHVNGMGAFKPYVGVGLQYINFFDTGAGDNLLGAQKVSIDDAVGFTLQAGLDLSLGNGWYLNADVKKTWLDTTVTWRNNAALGGLNVVGDADLDPWIFSGGLGYRFNLFGPRMPEPAPIALEITTSRTSITRKGRRPTPLKRPDPRRALFLLVRGGPCGRYRCAARRCR